MGVLVEPAPDPLDHLERRDLPRLPVPHLATTRNRFLGHVMPLLDSEGYNSARRVADRFFGSKEAAVLQDILLARVRDRTSWLEDWWLEMYLEMRIPTPVNVNAAFTLGLKPTPSVQRAAILVAGAVEFRRLIFEGELAPDREGGADLCMTQYGRLFGTYRTPRHPVDAIGTAWESRHAAVAHRGRLYALEVVDSSGRPVPTASLASAIETICGAEDDGEDVGILTSGDRQVWADDRSRLEALSPANREALASIDAALFVLRLDGTSPTDQNEHAATVLHGEGRSAWYDKLQIVVCANGLAGVNLEHALVDGHTVGRLVDWLTDYTLRAEPLGPTTGPAREPRWWRLPFELDSRTRRRISDAQRRFTSLGDGLDLCVVRFADFGRTSLKSWGVSPDGFVQMAFQLAYHRMTGRVESTYESCMLKRFFHGRTGCVRSVSSASVALIRAFESSDAEPAGRVDALRQAIDTHAAAIASCKEGQDVDRHLYGLWRAAQEQGQHIASPTREFFAHDSYRRLTRSVISTSNVPSAHVGSLCGFGPVVPEGIGLGYTIRDDAIEVCVTSFREEAEAFGRSFIRSLRDLADSLEADFSHHCRQTAPD